MFQALWEVRYTYESLVGKLEEARQLVPPPKMKNNMWVWINLSAPELFFLILAHPVYKM
jgi:hypothetical protein